MKPAITMAGSQWGEQTQDIPGTEHETLFFCGSKSGGEKLDD